MRSCPALVLVVAAFTAVVGCKQSPTDAAERAVVDDDGPPLPVVRDESTELLFSFVDASGRMLSVPSVAAVPEPVRQRVLVVDLAKTPEQRRAHRFAIFADLTTKQADGSYPVVVVSRYDAAQKGAGVAALPAPDGAVIVYSAEWCGYCKKAKAWLKERGVPFIERDVEKTAGASAEVQEKLKKAGVPGGGIPVIDWGGNIVVGYDVASFERLLAAAPPSTTPPSTTPPSTTTPSTTPPSTTPPSPPSTTTPPAPAP